MRTLNQLQSRIAFRQRRQTLLRALGAPAAVLAQEADVTDVLKREYAAREARVQRFFGVSVA